jgi:hypothetical protein
MRETSSDNVFCDDQCQNIHYQNIDARGRRFRGVTNFAKTLPRLFNSLFDYSDKAAELMTYSASVNHEDMRSWALATRALSEIAIDIDQDVERVEKMLSVLDAPGLANRVENALRRLVWALINYVNDVASPTPTFIETVTDEISEAFLNAVFKAIEMDAGSADAVELLGLWVQPGEKGLRNAVQGYIKGITADEPWSERTGWRQDYVKVARSMGEKLDAYYRMKRDEARAGRR